MNQQSSISTEFAYKSQYQQVCGSKLHYIDVGEGDPMLFLHGMPTSNYLWRNVIPYVSDAARYIAPDLIGMGKSDKPDIAYRIFDHIEYIDNFISELGLDKITLVLHGWGSVIGFDYAMRNPDKIKGLAFYESHVRPAVDWDMLSLPVQQFVNLLSDEKAGYSAVIEHNYFINKVLRAGVLRRLQPSEFDHYLAPFATQDSRKLLWQYLQDLPKGDGPKDVVALIENYSKKLQQSQLPKLMLYAVPGFITTIDTVRWSKEHLPNLKVVDLGEGMHFIQETDPQAFGNALANWYGSLP